MSSPREFSLISEQVVGQQGQATTFGSWILLLSLAFTLYSTGVIWVMQVIQYPAFGLVGRSEFSAVHSAHNQHLMFTVILPMMLAFVFTIALLWVHPVAVPAWSVWLCVAAVAVVLVSTFLILIPLHMRLTNEGFSEEVIRSLVRSNWIRTASWTSASILLLWMVGRTQQ